MRRHNLDEGTLAEATTIKYAPGSFGWIFLHSVMLGRQLLPALIKGRHISETAHAPPGDEKRHPQVLAIWTFLQACRSPTPEKFEGLCKVNSTHISYNVTSLTCPFLDRIQHLQRFEPHSLARCWLECLCRTSANTRRTRTLCLVEGKSVLLLS